MNTGKRTAQKSLTEAWGLESKLTKEQLTERLARHYCRLFGHSDMANARAFVRKNHPSKFDMVLACKNAGISIVQPPF